MPETTLYPLSGRRVWVAGHRGLVGSALVRRLAREDCEILTAGRDSLDLRSPDQVDLWMKNVRPEAVFVAAAKVGGIHANDTQPATFLYDNLMIEANVIEAARRYGVEKLVFLGSSCIYPRLAPQPIPASALLTGALEPTNEWYAIAKIAGLKLCQAYRRQHGCDFISLMPTNLYGPGDNFDLQQSHVVPALIAKAHQARATGAASLSVWGSGTPLREFLHVDDAADGIVFAMQHYSGEAILNLGSGEEVSIGDLARMICTITGYSGQLAFDVTKPDGTPRKVVDSSELRAIPRPAAQGANCP
ncbi:GDP-L-fucose synthase family protein, partial [Ferrovibrio sp.]|uniref:GDP-L-fucose synthase family protein n=1 Tax=Ferrovibrio sp. TaxID=1917215 RepID=UPI0035B22B44